MTLFEHLRELRGRLFKACLGIAIGAIIGGIFATRILDYLQEPYCSYVIAHSTIKSACTFTGSSPLAFFLLKLKVALYCGLILGAPIWLYQLWAFIAPGLHKRERRYTYAFVAVAVPLFFAGIVLAHLVVTKSLRFFLDAGKNTLIISDVSGYFSFVTKMMLLFGAGFEFPLLVVMLNVAGMLSGRKMLGWWRQAVFLMFVFGAVVTPTPDPFSMSILALCMSVLYFGAVIFALVNDRRRGRNARYAGLADDEASAIEDEAGESGAPGASGADAMSEPVYASGPVAPPQPLDGGFDDYT